MPFPQNQVYIRWEFGWQPSGATGPIEIQNFGIWATVPYPQQPPFPGWNNVVNDGAQRAANAWRQNVDPGRFSSPVVFNRAIVYHYDQAHNVVLDRGESPGSDSGQWKGAGTATLPPENSVALSLYAFQPGTYQFQPGRHRGRIYLPTPTRQLLNNDGVLDTAGRVDLQGDMTDFWEQLVGTFDTVHFEPQIVSRAGEISSPITWLRIGRVVDTQRRRRNKLPEDYLNFAAPQN